MTRARVDTMQTLYLRKVTGPETIMCELSGGSVVRASVCVGDVTASNRAGGTTFAIWPWYYRNKPTRRNRYVTLNCNRYKVEWWTP